MECVQRRCEDAATSPSGWRRRLEDPTTTVRLMIATEQPNRSVGTPSHRHFGNRRPAASLATWPYVVPPSPRAEDAPSRDPKPRVVVGGPDHDGGRPRSPLESRRSRPPRRRRPSAWPPGRTWRRRRSCGRRRPRPGPHRGPDHDGVAVDRHGAAEVSPARRRRPSAWPPGRTWHRRRRVGKRRRAQARGCPPVAPTTMVSPSIATESRSSRPPWHRRPSAWPPWPLEAHAVGRAEDVGRARSAAGARLRPPTTRVSPSMATELPKRSSGGVVRPSAWPPGHVAPPSAMTEDVGRARRKPPSPAP